MKLLILTFAITLFGTLLMPSVAMAQIDDDDILQACLAVKPASECTPDQLQQDDTFDGIWRSILNIATFVVSLISVLMIIIGGLRYVLSNGDQQGTAGAKNTILYAIIGLVVAIAARTIILFVVDRI